MSITSNAQGLLFVSISTEQSPAEGGTPVATLKDWFGSQQVGQAKSAINDAVVSRRGVVTHTVGDAVLCSFAAPKSALEAAIDIQRRMAQAMNRASGMVVRAKAGLSYGPVRVIAGKVSGDAVTAAGMLMERCAPGDIMLDQAVADALGKSAVELEAAGSIDGIAAYRVRVDAPRDSTINLRVPVPPPGEAQSPVPTAPAPAPAQVPAVPAAAKAAQVLILKFGGTEQRFHPSDGEVSLGRGLDNRVVVPVPSVSRKHARIVWGDDGLPYLSNLSANGSSVRFRPTGREVACTGEVCLEGSGDIALSGTFAAVSSQSELVFFRLAAD